ncbi:hypothetical protein NH340_JMT08446 [Sarcoptes scabiei]|nr:hypothetical protein NH340_JMT08446 [Sarcoptes scabiei]
MDRIENFDLFNPPKSKFIESYSFARNSDDDDYDGADATHPSWRDYILSKRKKFDKDLDQRKKFLAEIRKRATELQQSTRQKFRLKPPTNIISTLPLNEYDFPQKITESIAVENISPILIYEYLNLYYFGTVDKQIENLMKNVCIYVNGYTRPVASHLHKLISLAGGRYTLVFDAYRTTHTIATALSESHKKSERIKKSTVKPEWIIDCLRAKKLLPLYKYLVAKPENGMKELINKMNRESKKTGKFDHYFDLDSQSDKEREKKTDHGKKFQYRSSGSPELLEIFDFHNAPIVENDSKISTNDTIESKIEKSDINLPLIDYRHENNTNVTSNHIGSEQIGMSKNLSINVCALTMPTTVNRAVTETSHRRRLKGKRGANKTLKSSDHRTNSKQLRIDFMLKREICKDNNPIQLALDIYFDKRGTNLRPNICGKTSIDEICQLLDEWISSYKMLQDLDVTYVIKYILRLVDNQRFEDLKKILLKVKQSIQNQSFSIDYDYDQWRMMFNQTLHSLLLMEPSIPEDLFSECFNTNVVEKKVD